MAYNGDNGLQRGQHDAHVCRVGDTVQGQDQCYDGAMVAALSGRQLSGRVGHRSGIIITLNTNMNNKPECCLKGPFLVTLGETLLLYPIRLTHCIDVTRKRSQRT